MEGWILSNQLQLSAVKAVVIWYSSLRRQYQILSHLFAVGNDVITPVFSIWEYNIYVSTFYNDSDLFMLTHVSSTVSACFASLCQIRSLCWSVTQPVLQLLVAALTLFHAGLSSYGTTEQTVVCSPCSCPISLLGPKGWTCVSTSPWSPLASNPTVDKVSTLCPCLPLPQWYSATASCWRVTACGRISVHVLGFILRQRRYCKFHSRSAAPSVTKPPAFCEKGIK